MSGNNIKVVCRFRPQNKREIAEGGNPIVEVDDEGQSVRIDNGSDIKQDFVFDRIFPMGTPQAEIFEYGIRETVDDVFNGYNGTVFAYGQTGAGKTFSMMGDMESQELKGIIPRIVETAFKKALASPANMEYTMRVAYMEIYMEKIRDLLSPANNNLAVHEDKSRGVYVKNLTEIYVSSIEEVYKVLQRGGGARMVAYTNMNAESSRSHSIFQISISQKNTDTGAIKNGRLYLVDLAGSEKVGKTGASGQTLEEAKKINKSLSALGMVINALTDGKSKYIPYRDSKLTRILQESLGGNSRTTLIINCSPSSFNDQETLGTLRFGMRAKSITNKAKVNADLSPAELKALLKRAKAQAVTFNAYIGALEGEVSVWRTGGTVSQDDWASMEKIKPGSGAAPSTESAPTSTPPTKSDSALADDEREEFLKRENELTDQIAEKESELAAIQQNMTSIQEEHTILLDESKILREENKGMSGELDTLRVELDRVKYEAKESVISLDSLNEANSDLSRELEELRSTLAQLRASARESEEEDKAAVKAEKMAAMMASLGTGAINAKQTAIRETIESLQSMEGDGVLSQTEVITLRSELAEMRTLREAQEASMEQVKRENETLIRRRDEMESRLTTLELEYEELLDKTIAEEENGQDKVVESIHELRTKVEAQYAAKKELQQKELEEYKALVEEKAQDILTHQATIADLRRRNEELEASISRMAAESAAATAAASEGEAASGVDGSAAGTNKDVTEKEREIERIKQTMAQQLADFDMMKKALMKDLQDRCERVVDLEMNLDKAKEQYNSAIRTTNAKVQQKKMSFLERNMEQLSGAQKTLTEQNAHLKKEYAIAERKLITRNERIVSLEALLADAQGKLKIQNAKFEQQLSSVRKRLENARSTKQDNEPFFAFGRIAKPIRGGGAISVSPGSTGEDDGTEAVVSAPTASSGKGSRASWLGWRN
ncbi:kinesin heavy chain [Piptocephalis cylindrospora]|uniref:Kinesin-like protein n=1 Tax=Piptocephalis cylindrospora TaxID=1907219 RepID=A0A4P9Y2S9_9FUNG|nr:kinesin heavy chain [Piptocephalis cylindrospora]|eukprot:RKP12964.1 kinesin heavy chain [Piptocephalis cylindrospora]